MPLWLLAAVPVALVGYFLYKQSSTAAAPSSGAAATYNPGAPAPGGLHFGITGLGQALAASAAAMAGAGSTSVTLDSSVPQVNVPAYAGVFTIYLPSGATWDSVPISYDIQTVSTSMPVMGSNPAQIILTGVPGTVDVYWTDSGGNPVGTTLAFQ